MQDSSNTSGGGNELNRASGLARFRSAPATWLDALLEDDDSLKLSGPHHQGGLTQLLSSGSNLGPSTRPNHHHHHSSSYMSSSSAAAVVVDQSYFENSGTHHLQQQQQQPRPQQQQQQQQQQEQEQGSNSNNNTVSFQRMNSSPAEFLSGNMDGYFSSFGGSYEFVGSDVSPSKRMRDNNNNSNSDNIDQLSPNLRRGEQSGQLSTANSLVELEMEKLLEDSVPCRVRAKRGCATHPRSIAERVRRTRISDRIRKLQELVPNMDKQTNTADMLEEAVEYVKTLQRQIQELTEQQKKCKCMAKS